MSAGERYVRALVWALLALAGYLAVRLAIAWWSA